jgi:hypothetical protein
LGSLVVKYGFVHTLPTGGLVVVVVGVGVEVVVEVVGVGVEVVVEVVGVGVEVVVEVVGVGVGAGAAVVVNEASEPYVVPFAFVATSL